MERNGKIILALVAIVAVIIVIITIMPLILSLEINTEEEKTDYMSVAVGESVQLLFAENCTLCINKLIVDKKKYKDYYNNLSNSQYIMLCNNTSNSKIEVTFRTKYEPEYFTTHRTNIRYPAFVIPDENLSIPHRSIGVFYDFDRKEEHLIHFMEIEDARYVGNECKLFVKLWTSQKTIKL